MAKYTIELGRLIKSGFDIGLADYPIFSEDHRKTLNNKIIEHYYFREIGLETPALFKRFLNRKMAEIMPYYNQLYTSELIEFDPLENYSRSETMSRGEQTDSEFETSQSGSRLESGSSESSGENAAHSKDVQSDTPQGFLSIDSIESNTYASSADMSETGGTESGSSSYESGQESSASSEGTQGQTVQEDLTRTITGKDGSMTYSEMLSKYRSTFLNIDLMIIEELEPLFMQIF